MSEIYKGMLKDLKVIKNGIIYLYNNGLYEGSVNKIKVIKRISLRYIEKECSREDDGNYGSGTDEEANRIIMDTLIAFGGYPFLTAKDLRYYYFS